MATALVDRATSTGLLGPDWSVNMEICDVINREPRQAKEVVKSLKKKVNSKNSRVQLLSLMLLETLVKNCGDIVHMHIAERDIPREMVKIVKKKSDFHVNEKILMLIDTWQEAFGGPRAQYRQYFAAYRELLRAGVVFPQRRDSTAPIFTPPQTQPITSHPQSLRSPNSRQEAPESSTHDLPSLSLIEMQNARGIMGVLSEMLNALNPTNREGLRQEIIVDLVDQCRSYKRRVVHLVNTTLDEALLDKGLVLNDDLERVLAKHDAIAAGIAIRVERPKPSVQVIDSGVGKSETAPGKQNDRSSTSTTGVQSPPERLLPAPPSKEKNVTTTALVKMDPHMDLLSGDAFSTPAENSLALVPINQLTALSAFDQNVLALADMFAQNENAHGNSNTTISNSFPSHAAAPGQTTTTELQVSRPEQPVLHPNGGISNSKAFQHDLTLYNPRSQLTPVNSIWDSQATRLPSSQQQQPLTFAGPSGYGEEALPPPPWETQSAEENHPDVSQLHTIQNPLGGMYAQQIHSPSNGEMYNQQIQNSQIPSFNSHPLQGVQMVVAYQYPMQDGQMAVMPVQPAFLSNQAGGYAYAQLPMTQYYYNQSMPPYRLENSNDLSQRMYGLSMQGDSRLMNGNPSHPMLTASALSVQMHQPIKPPPKAEDNLFGDLLSMAKSKQRKPPINKSGSL